MPRVYFTRRKRISREDVSLLYRPGPPPEFSATIDLRKHKRRLPPDANVIVEAYHNTMRQRFDFGTVADCRPRDSLKLTGFDDGDPPLFRVRVVNTDDNAGAVLASCERIEAVEPEQSAEGGRSLLKLFPLPDSRMQGELWRIQEVGGGYQLCYNKDAAPVQHGIKAKDPLTLGLILPAAIREILARELLWDGHEGDESSEWVTFAESIAGTRPSPADDGSPLIEEMASWIEQVATGFCRNRARFLEQIQAAQEGR